MSKITINLVKLIEQAVPQLLGAVDLLLLQQWLGHNIGAEQPVTVDLAAVRVEDKAVATLPILSYLEPRVSDVIVFNDASELHIYVLVPGKSADNVATNAYYRLLATIADL